MLDYYDVGCTTMLIRGFDSLNDALDYGRELIPLSSSTTLNGRPPGVSIATVPVKIKAA